MTGLRRVLRSTRRAAYRYGSAAGDADAIADAVEHRSAKPLLRRAWTVVKWRAIGRAGRRLP